MTSADYAAGALRRGLRAVRTHREDGTLSPEFLTDAGIFRRGPGRERRGVNAGAVLLCVASALLAANAAAMGLVSWHAQYAFVLGVKHQHAASALEALGLDAGAVIFAVLGIALARLGRRAGIERALVVLCAAGSCGMNLLGADLGSPRSVAVYAMPPVLFAAGSDRLIAVIRRAAMGPREDDESQRSAWRVAGVAVLYGLRLVVAPPSTLAGARRALIAATPLPGAATAAAVLAIDPPEVTVECPLCMTQVAVSDGRIAEHECADVTRDEDKRQDRDEDEHEDDAGRQPPPGPREGSKTSLFLARVVYRHGPLAGVGLEKVGRIAADLHGDLDEGAARRALRTAILAAVAAHDESDGIWAAEAPQAGGAR